MLKLRSLLVLSLTVLAFVGCGTTRSSSADAWEHCKPEFPQRVAHLSSQAIDCGFLPFPLFSGAQSERSKVVGCAKSALSSGKSFKLGYGSFGDDDGSCHAVIRTDSGQLLSVTSQYALVTSNGEQRSTFISRCQSVTIGPASTQSGALLFELSGCEIAPDLQEETRAHRVQGMRPNNSFKPMPLRGSA
jgi:hypothetical protein